MDWHDDGEQKKTLPIVSQNIVQEFPESEAPRMLTKKCHA